MVCGSSVVFLCCDCGTSGDLDLAVTELAGGDGGAAAADTDGDHGY